MINIWEFAYEDDIRIISKSGKTYEGNIVAVNDAEEIEGATEDEITIETYEGKIVGLKQSEVEKIEYIKK